MAFDFSKIKVGNKDKPIVDPIAIFQKLRISDAGINDLWLAQGDALREWHDNRNKADISISLNTGAGKTLVGLLVAQSLVNETRGLILYACSSIQLILQTEKKAQGYGIPITTYYDGNFSNSLASKGEAACLTTYQALFNGRSIFQKRDMSGIVFDDAHAAEHMLRDHFSLRVKRQEFPSLYNLFSAEFKSYFDSVGLSATFADVVNGIDNRLLMIPPSEIKRTLAVVMNHLTESQIKNENSTKFSWEHLKDRIDLCAVILSNDEITFTPPFVPVRTLSYFKKDIRRVYLSATLDSMDVFVRTFGRYPEKNISPKTTAGECERMILLPQLTNDLPGSDVDAAKAAIKSCKALILIPNYSRAECWKDMTELPSREQATERIEQFKSEKGNTKLLLSARYDGVDLPGDMCRVLVLDELPSGVGPLERFSWEYLAFTNMLRTAIASRIVQSFGRISRGMSDHGVAILTGKRLTEWIQIPANMSCLPVFLQKQIQLGFQISNGMKANELPSMLQQCLQRNKEWVGAYERFMNESEGEANISRSKEWAEVCLAEAKYIEQMWYRDYTGAAKSLQAVSKKAESLSTNTVCWHKLWFAYALEQSGDLENAFAVYQQAHAGQRNIPAPRPETLPPTVNNLSTQVLNVSKQFEIKSNGKVQIPRNLEQDLLNLNGEGSVKQTEESIRCLGQYLGFKSSRPDNEAGTGPDVLWEDTEWLLCMDAKTDKEPSGHYKKDELGQLSDHVQWVKDRHPDANIIPLLVGPLVGATGSANPQKGVKITTLKSFDEIGKRIKAAYKDVAASALPLNVGSIAHEKFEALKLLATNLHIELNFLELRDIKRKED